MLLFIHQLKAIAYKATASQTAYYKQLTTSNLLQVTLRMSVINSVTDFFETFFRHYDVIHKDSEDTQPLTMDDIMKCEHIMPLPGACEKESNS